MVTPQGMAAACNLQYTLFNIVNKVQNVTLSFSLSGRYGHSMLDCGMEQYDDKQLYRTIYRVYISVAL